MGLKFPAFSEHIKIIFEKNYNQIKIFLFSSLPASFQTMNQKSNENAITLSEFLGSMLKEEKYAEEALKSSNSLSISRIYLNFQ